MLCHCVCAIGPQGQGPGAQVWPGTSRPFCLQILGGDL